MLAQAQPRVALRGSSVNSDPGRKPKRELKAHQKNTPQTLQFSFVLHTLYPASVQLSEQYGPSDMRPAGNLQKDSFYNKEITNIIGDIVLA